MVCGGKTIDAVFVDETVEEVGEDEGKDGGWVVVVRFGRRLAVSLVL